MNQLHQLYPLFWAFFAIVMLSQVMPFVITVFRLLRFQFGDITFTRLDDATVLTPLQQAAIDEIAALGFERYATYKVNDGHDQCTAVMLKHSTLPVVANIYLRAGSFMAYPTWFWSFAKSGEILMTANRQPISQPLPGVTRLDPFVPTLQQHWQAHQARIAGVELENVTAEQAYDKIKAATTGYAAYNLAQRNFTGTDGQYFLTLKAAVAMTREYMGRRRALRTPYQTVVIGDRFRSEFYAETYAVYEESKKRLKARRSVSLWLLLISGAISLGLFTAWLGWKAAVAVIIVLLVHECGHALAMRLFGYRDMNMFFIPFMGAVVTGNNKNVPVWQQAIVLLAGPVPGLLFGIWVVLHIHSFPPNGFMIILGINAAIINLFNLLPLAFLDGGKLVEMTLLTRFPFALFGFVAFSAAALTGIMIYLKSYNMLAISAVLFLAARLLWRVAKVRAAVKREGTTGLAPLFALTEKLTGAKSFTRQYYIVRSIQDTPFIRPARRWEIAFSLLLFVASWGIAGLGWQAWQHDRAMEAKFDAAMKHMYAKEGDIAIANAALNLSPDDPRQIDALAVAAFRLKGAERDKAMEDIIALHRDGHSYSRGTLLTNYLDSADWNMHRKPLPERIAAVENYLARADKLAPDLYADTVNTRLHLAELRDQNGQPDKAQADLTALLSTTAHADNCGCAERDVVAAQAWFYIDKGQPEKAVSFLETAPYNAMAAKANNVGVAYAWALLEAGKADAGLAQMKTAAPVYHDDDPYEAENLDLIYALWKTGHVNDAVALVPIKHRDYYCDADEVGDVLYDNLWHGRAVAETKKALQAVCAALPAKPSGR